MKSWAALLLGIAVILAACSLGNALPGGPSPDPRRSGFEDMGLTIQAMQRDDLSNPGMLSVQEGRELWRRPAGRANRACAACHGEPERMKGVAARYPAWDDTLGRPVDLGMRIALCRERHQQAPAWRPESRERLSLEALIAHQSRGLPLAPDRDARLAPHRARGAELFRERMGQLDLSCSQCHDQRAGLRLGASLIPQGHPTGYPIYRLEWQTLGSLQRRLRNCMAGVRAEPYAQDSPEMVELELHLVQRAVGMLVDSPGVRP